MDAAPPPIAGIPRTDYAELAKATPGVVGAAHWFWWIAGLSIINTVLMHSGSETSFIVGLGFTLVADSVFQGVKVLAFALDAAAVGAFITFGYFAARGRVWAFVVGGILYLLDGLIYVLFQEWLPVAFHAFVLYSLFVGFRALRSAIGSAGGSGGQ